MTYANVIVSRQNNVIVRQKSIIVSYVMENVTSTITQVPRRMEVTRQVHHWIYWGLRKRSSVPREHFLRRCCRVSSGVDAPSSSQGAEALHEVDAIDVGHRIGQSEHDAAHDEQGEGAQKLRQELKEQTDGEKAAA